MNKFFQIRNGFRERVVRMYNYPLIKLGINTFLIGFILMLFGAPLAVSGGAVALTGTVGAAKLAFTPLILRFKKEGLDGDNLKFLNDLEQRISLQPNSEAKTELLNIIKESTKGYEELAARMKDFDSDKLKLLQEFLGTDDKGIRSILTKQGTAIQELVAKLDKKPEDLSVRGQIDKWRESNKTALEELKAGKKANLSPLEIRLNSPMTPANTLNGSAYIPRPEFESGATEIVRPRLTFWETLIKGRSSSSVYVWVNKKNPEGAAGWIGPGVAKPGISLELASETSIAKKVAASAKVALELLNDVEGFASFVEGELRFQVDSETNDKLMDSVASATEPEGIKQLSVAYTLDGVETTNPNNWDALIAVETQLEAGNLAGEITHFVNPVDYANMILTKAQSQGQLYIPKTPTGRIIKDNNLPAGTFQSAILQYYEIKIYQDYTVTYGLADDDFLKNLISLVGERRIHQFSKENYTGFAIRDTFDNVKAAIDGEAP